MLLKELKDYIDPDELVLIESQEAYDPDNDNLIRFERIPSRYWNYNLYYIYSAFRRDGFVNYLVIGVKRGEKNE